MHLVLHEKSGVSRMLFKWLDLDPEVVLRGRKFPTTLLSIPGAFLEYKPQGPYQDAIDSRMLWYAYVVTASNNSRPTAIGYVSSGGHDVQYPLQSSRELATFEVYW